MRVGLICPYSLTVPGGVQVQVLGLARALRVLGHEARVLAPSDGPPPDAGVTPLGASVPTAANGSVAPLAPDPSAQLRTIRALRDEGFDVVHLHEPLCPGPTQTALLFKNAPLLGTFHAAGDSASYKYLRGPLRWLAGRLDVRCAVSDAAADLAGRYLGGRYLPVFNGIEVDLWAKAEPWQHDHEGSVVFFVGRHEPRKGLDVLLAAVERLPASVRVWVAGDGPDTAELRHRHDDPRIEWLGRIGDDEKHRRMAAADAFCAPALRGESFGIVLLEAMAAGTPVVASDIDGYRNVASDGVDACLVPPGDPEALAAALAAVTGDAGLAAGLVSGGRDRAEQFSMAHLAERYVELYRSIA
jgi:phosphatidylinositol alpha-mannosyltransferase